MKGIHIFCSSQPATTLMCPNMNEASSSSSSSSISSTAQLGGGRAIDRHNPIIRDSRRAGNHPLPPLSPHPKLTQKHYSKNQKNLAKKAKIVQLDDEKLKRNDEKVVVRKSWSCTKPGDFISPAASTRYLLSDNKAFLDLLPDFDPVLKLVHDEPSKPKDDKKDDFDPVLKLVHDEPSKPKYYKKDGFDPVLKLVHDEPSKPKDDKEDESCDGKTPSLSESPEQVVVLRVSLHCKGCERKMRKHISRMEGVKSFDIDFAARKVTVIGDVTPLGVLASVSKVKNAQLWPPTLSSSASSSPLTFSTPQFNYYKGA